MFLNNPVVKEFLERNQGNRIEISDGGNNRAWHVKLHDYPFTRGVSISKPELDTSKYPDEFFEDTIVENIQMINREKERY